MKTKKTLLSKILVRTPRILAIIFSLLMIIDVIGAYTISEEINSRYYIQVRITAILFTTITFFSRKHQLFGAIFFVIFGIWYMIQGRGFPIGRLFVIGGPAITTGILFFVNWLQKRKNK